MENYSQFDAFVRVYENDTLLPYRRHIEAYSFFKALGTIEGKAVLDVGCGAGLYCRKLKERGAARVVGLDASVPMVEYARVRDQKEQTGIEYVVDDVVNAAKYGPFDVVTAIYVLPYADTYEKLRAMCKGIYDALVPGGRLVTMPISPAISLERKEYYNSYGLMLSPVDEKLTQDQLKDGTPMRLVTTVPELPLDVVFYHWSTATQVRAFWEAGFSTVTFHRVELAAEGVSTHGEEHWRDYISRPHSSPVVCVKEAAS
jgi:toxoflavin synthase